MENTIGRIRNFIPKGVNLRRFTRKQIQWLENQLNNTPRKCLNYLTPNEAMMSEVNKYKYRRYLLQKQAGGALQTTQLESPAVRPLGEGVAPKSSVVD